MFPALLRVPSATLGKLLLQHGAGEDASKSTDKALQAFSSWGGLSEIGLVGE